MTELGNKLKETRESKQISLDDLQQITKIQKRYLIGIEEGNYQIMPGKFYVRAFVKQYAEAVGLDPDEIFHEYKHELPNTINEDIPNQLSRVTSRKQISAKGSKLLEMIPMILIIIVILGTLIALWFFFQGKNVGTELNDENSKEQTEVEESENSPINDPNETSEENSVSNSSENEQTEENDTEEESVPQQQFTITEKSGIAATVELSNTDTFLVEISAKPDKQTWVGIKNGKGKNFLSELLTDGAKRQFDLTEEQSITFNIGNTIDTELLINGIPFEFPSPPTDKVQQIITIKFVKLVE
ncbi:DUF4115 domain-containing protein [Bacillus timonensis]|nr:DUF4115 domain-containing protein [Bacillus timonensis]